MILGGNLTIADRTPVRDHAKCGNVDCDVVLCVCDTRCWAMPRRACDTHLETFCDEHRDSCGDCSLDAAYDGLALGGAA